MINKDITSFGVAALNESINTAKALLGKIFGPAADEFGLMIGDNMKIRRLNNQIKNLNKVQKIVHDNDITIKQVNLKVLVPYLENVSLEEDELLQDMWANLLVNYIDTTEKLTTTVYPSILSQLSSKEVSILNDMIGIHHLNHQEIYAPWSIEVDDQPLLNLTRLGLVEEIFEIEYKENVRYLEIEIERKSTGKFKLTKFGNAFLVACQREH
jgi:hypothetical protein